MVSSSSFLGGQYALEILNDAPAVVVTVIKYEQLSDSDESQGSSGEKEDGDIFPK